MKWRKLHFILGQDATTSVNRSKLENQCIRLMSDIEWHTSCYFTSVMPAAGTFSLTCSATTHKTTHMRTHGCRHGQTHPVAWDLNKASDNAEQLKAGVHIAEKDPSRLNCKLTDRQMSGTGMLTSSLSHRITSIGALPFLRGDTKMLWWADTYTITQRVRTTRRKKDPTSARTAKYERDTWDQSNDKFVLPVKSMKVWTKQVLLFMATWEHLMFKKAVAWKSSIALRNQSSQIRFVVLTCLYPILSGKGDNPDKNCRFQSETREKHNWNAKHAAWKADWEAHLLPGWMRFGFVLRHWREARICPLEITTKQTEHNKPLSPCKQHWLCGGNDSIIDITSTQGVF